MQVLFQSNDLKITFSNDFQLFWPVQGLLEREKGKCICTGVESERTAVTFTLERSEILSFTYTANGLIRQIQVENFSKQKMNR